MINYTKVAELINGYLRTNHFPELEFKQEVSLRSPTHALMAQSELSNDADINEPTVVNNLLAELEIANKDMAANGSIFTEFQNTADAFAKKLNSALVELRNIKKEVTGLVAETASVTQNLLAADLEVSTLNNIQSNDVGFDAMDWSGIDFVGSERAIVIKQHGKLNMDESHPMDDTTIALMIARLPFIEDGMGIELSTIEVSEELKAKIIGKLEVVAKERYNSELIYLAKEILSPEEYSFTRRNKQLKEVASTGDGLITLMHDIRDLALVISTLTSEEFGLSKSSLEILEKNCELFREYLLIQAYIAIYFRREVYANAILIGPTLYNPDKWEEFVAAGGDLQKLATYYSYYHKSEDNVSIAVPFAGVSIKYIMDNLETAQAKIEAQAAQLTSSTSEKTKNATRQAFGIVALRYIQKQDDSWFSQTFTTADRSGYIFSVYDSTVDGTPLEDMFYDIFFNCSNNMWLTVSLYRKLGTAYMKHISSSEEYTAETGDVVDFAVFASVISEFIVQHLFKCDDELTVSTY